MTAEFAPLLTLPGQDCRNVLLATNGGDRHVGDGRNESGLLAHDLHETQTAFGRLVV